MTWITLKLSLKNVPKMDFLSWCDPFIRVNAKTNVCDKITCIHQTEVKTVTEEPRSYQLVEFETFKKLSTDHHDYVVFEIWDHDDGFWNPDDKIGEVRLNIDDLQKLETERSKKCCNCFYNFFVWM